VFDLDLGRHVIDLGSLVLDLGLGLEGCGLDSMSEKFSVTPKQLCNASRLEFNREWNFVICCCCCYCCDCRRFVATELPLRYRKLVANPSRCYVVVAGLWAGAIVTFIAPLLTKPDWSYYRYNVNQKMCGLHWEYPSFCVITGLYIPILSGAVLIIIVTIITVIIIIIIIVVVVVDIIVASPTLYGAVLIFTGLRIKWTLSRRQNVQIRLCETTPQIPTNVFHQQSATMQSSRRSTTRGSRRTLKILTFTSVAYFTFWSPYVIMVLAQSFVSSFQPPSAVEFTVMWLANANSAVNVFIYSSTNAQFRRQCVRLASRLCCSRLSSVCIGRDSPSCSSKPSPPVISISKSTLVLQ